MNILFRQRAPGWNPFGLLVEKSYSFEKFELLSTWAVELSVSDPEECSDLVTPWSRPARPSLWHVFLGEMKCTNTNTHYTNVQIQIHKYKCKNMNTQIQMQAASKAKTLECKHALVFGRNRSHFSCSWQAHMCFWAKSATFLNVSLIALVIAVVVLKQDFWEAQHSKCQICQMKTVLLVFAVL